MCFIQHSFLTSLAVCFFSFSQTPMKNAKALIGDAGATFENAVSARTQQCEGGRAHCDVLGLSFGIAGRQPDR